MPPPKKRSVPPPIDRPLSKAYLREFSGWSNEWAPGVSDPTSLRLMENVLIDRDGAALVRPGMRSYLRHTDLTANFDVYGDIVGTHEVFFLANGDKAYLYAYRDGLGNVKFRAMVELDSTHLKSVSLESLGFTVGAGVQFTLDTTYVKFLQVDNRIFALSNAGEEMHYFSVGAVKVAKNLQTVTRPAWTNADKLSIIYPEKAWIDSNSSGNVDTIPTAVPNGSRTVNSLITQDKALNVHFFGYFYTTYTEIGESAPSKVQTTRAARSWIGWEFETPNASNEPSGTETTNPYLAADQLVAVLPSAVATQAISEGALGWNLYMLTWSDQDAVPVTAVKLGTRLLDGSVHSRYIVHTPAQDILQDSVPVPNSGTLDNYTTPPKAAQGIVASDRAVLVNDVTNPALIRWTSREQGSYTDFTAHRGGGFKTLTSGNLYLTACVKLWQNPSSVDTLTILCAGVDGHSTGYYMAPATVSSQSEQIQIMGFEETTATPGTTSPYGCEVVNNALYHPLDEMLMKSTAMNYNINHKSMTELISDSWQRLLNKQNIVSSVLDNRIYLIVHNPEGEGLNANNLGNEVWVLDTAAKSPVWNRWLVGGRSLRKISVGGRLYMGIVTHQGLFYFDPNYRYDDVHDGTDVLQVPIPWKFETNTQGANRAHDAWARLQQVNPMFTEWQGTVEYGIRGVDLNGKTIEVKKIFQQPAIFNPDNLPLNVEDMLLIRRDLQEWFFFANSVILEEIIDDEPVGVLAMSHGGISSVQYRYAPSTVNSEYENGSIETFEYGSSLFETAP